MATISPILLIYQQFCSSPGSSLSPSVPPTALPSPSGRFAFGFYKQGNGFKVGIWLSGNNKTIVWTANHDDPPVFLNASLVLTKNGELLLQTGPGEKKVIAHSNNGTIFYASMLDSGNFVLRNKSLHILWQSFDYPTDTMLGGQTLPSRHQLVSSSSDTNHSSGRFELSMQADGNLVLYPRYSGDTSWDPYWASNTGYDTISKYYLFVNNTDSQPLCIVNASSTSGQNILRKMGDSSFKGNKTTAYRATIDFDGVLRLYAHFEDANRKHQVRKLWSPSELDNQCNVKTFFGFNSYCTTNEMEPGCNCLPGTDFIDPSHKNLGCKRNFLEAECKGGKDNMTLHSMYPMTNMAWVDPPYIEDEIQEEQCPSSPITVKADVYSYGVMLLEIVFCRKSLVVNMSNPEQIVLSNWVYKCFARRELNKLVVGEEVDISLLENMVKVGLWCIQDEPFLRPSMKSVVLMLEGVTEVAIPPCPSPDSI
ncbi:G-type lectin S-receptor-like serine/threonine-protein kinase LECRK3 [Neltuma alba]|uniref:G-type lectin S-receptor-like serine/threonine-protein kinase LECRK3 n=1 Tax=Neltuma alba TaxID=207710 RepID=UPI0010A50E0B|nr:G-type lectin S-receptor-like serine/threonine-protein kinase LECRK3 [Prosopis alba]